MTSLLCTLNSASIKSKFSKIIEQIYGLQCLSLAINLFLNTSILQRVKIFFQMKREIMRMHTAVAPKKVIALHGVENGHSNSMCHIVFLTEDSNLDIVQEQSN